MSAPADADVRVLQDDVREGLLRGVRADVAMRNFGQCLSTPEGSLAAMAEEDLAMSKVTMKLDDFISHDWQTGRWPKFIALCVIYNGDVALCGSCAVACLFTALENQPIAVLPRSSEIVGIPDQLDLKMRTAPWGFLCSLVTFWVLLLFGQRIRAVVGRNRILFLDRLCINQLDEEEKSEGIASLAGFMRHSDRLVVLWSPRYFTRLWCVYETATWLYLRKDLHSTMAFMPVGFAVGLVCLHVLETLITLLTFIACLVPTEFIGYNSVTVAVLLVALLAPWQVHTFRCLGGELRQLVSQLERFSIRNADCWCCTQAHVHPVSGNPLQCDRALVHRTLHARQGGAAASAHEALEQFDRAIRTTFKDAVSAAFGTVHMSYRQALMVTSPIAWGFPEFLSGVDRFADPLRGFRCVVGYCTIFLCVVPVTLRMTMAASTLSVRFCPPRRSYLVDAALSVTIALLPPVFGCARWVATVWAISKQSGLPQLVLLLGEVALTALFFGRLGGVPGCGHARRKEPPTLAVAVGCGDGMVGKVSEFN